jgi:YidC/Oxa1 family membrane protein insertase
MDKKSVIGFVVIGVILISWMVWTSKMQKPQPQQQQKTEVIPDSTKKDTVKSKDKINSQKQVLEQSGHLLDTNKLNESYGNIFSKNAIAADSSVSHKEKIIIIENNKYHLEFSNFGGAVKKAEMKNFKTWDGYPVQLVDLSKGKELNLMFNSIDGKLINTKDFIFNAKYNEWDKINIEENKDFKLIYELFVGGDSTLKIIKTYTFRPDYYDFDVEYEFVKPGKFITGNKYQLMWGNSLNLTEYRSDEEATFAEAYAYMGGELEDLIPSDFDKEIVADFNGNTDFVASRNKYFGVFLIPTSRKGDGAYMTGNKIKLPDAGSRNLFSVAVKMDIRNDASEKSKFKILLSPIDYNILKSYDMGLDKTMRFALDFIVRPIAQYFIIPFFTFIHKFVPNYGFVIIIFSIVLKILLHPLTKKQTESMKKMGQLNPKMTAIKEKYKDDPTKMNSMIMKLYKEEGINPMGGCLPMILQMPILYALFGVFRSTIELRQANFIWWIKDLAAPDVIFQLPFKIPIFGIDQVSGLATLMGITMFIQQKMTVTDPKQKAMVYMMPVMFTLLFFSFPSGLNLYYFMFNLLSIGQQYYTTKIKPPKIDEIKKPVKPSWTQRFMQRMQDQQKSIRKRK